MPLHAICPIFRGGKVVTRFSGVVFAHTDIARVADLGLFLDLMAFAKGSSVQWHWFGAGSAGKNKKCQQLIELAKNMLYAYIGNMFRLVATFADYCPCR